jgi:hypothetical protein
MTPTFQGSSIGHWDGKTLVVDTVGFVSDTVIAPGIPHSDEMHIIDPKVLVKPWTTTMAYKEIKGDLLEYICEQGNRDSASPNRVPAERIGGP